MIWKIRDREIRFSRTLLMGILNLTPDSFSDRVKFVSVDRALARVDQMIQEGPDIIDLGAESTRPGAEAIGASEELDRLLPLLEALQGRIEIPLSIDTTKPEVAAACLDAGAQIINDVSGLKDSGFAMAEIVRDSGAGLILMHRRGNPKTMQDLAHYHDVVREVREELRGQLAFGLECGIDEEQIVVDPGLGFAKNAEQNLEILRHLEIFSDLGRPVLLGPSRKSFIGQVTGQPVGAREFGTAAVAALAVMKGISILRIHEVGPMRDAVRMAEAIRGENYVGTF